MSDPLTREELSAELRAIRSESQANFERLVGELRTSQAEIRGDLKATKADILGEMKVVAARSAGKVTVWTAALTVAGLLIASVLVFGQSAQTGYDTGWNARGEVEGAVAK